MGDLGFKWSVFDPKDGLEINSIKWGSGVSKRKMKVSSYDTDSHYKTTGTGFMMEVGIMRRVRKINRYKSNNVNGEYDKVNERTHG